MGLLNGQVAIVTGAANPNGIGFATAGRFLEEGVIGLVLIDMDEKLSERVHELESKFPQALVRGHVADVTDDHQMTEVINLTFAEFGRIDSVVNNAAVNTPGNATQVTKESFMKTYMVNVYSQILMTRLVVPIMKEQGGGAIIDMCSGNALVSEYDLVQYVGSKGAIRSQTQANGLDFAAYNIRCNSIAPGLLHTGFNDPHHNHRGETKEQLTEAIDQIHPTGRLIQPVEIANVAVFLASSLSSALVGSMVVADAGFTIK